MTLPVVRVEPIEQGSDLDLFNRADPHCELCEGMGRTHGVICFCVAEVNR